MFFCNVLGSCALIIPIICNIEVAGLAVLLILRALSPCNFPTAAFDDLMVLAGAFLVLVSANLIFISSDVTFTDFSFLKGSKTAFIAFFVFPLLVV